MHAQALSSGLSGRIAPKALAAAETHYLRVALAEGDRDAWAALRRLKKSAAPPRPPPATRLRRP